MNVIIIATIMVSEGERKGSTTV